MHVIERVVSRARGGRRNVTKGDLSATIASGQAMSAKAIRPFDILALRKKASMTRVSTLVIVKDI